LKGVEMAVSLKDAYMASNPVQLSNPVRFVTAASLFDGHDAAINVMRRILQASGAEVIHLGHNRSVQDIVDAAVEEDVQGIAISSYQGGHMEFFKYMFDLLKERGAGHVKIYGGGGGVIVADEIDELHAYGISRIFSPEDGRNLGLQGMIDLMLRETDYSVTERGVQPSADEIAKRNPSAIARAITWAELGRFQELDLPKRDSHAPVVGFTGTGGAGKSSLTDEFLRRFLMDYPDKTVAVLSVDPSRKKKGGALLGDRIRMNSLSSPRIYMRSLATRGAKGELSAAIDDAMVVTQAAGFDLIILETSGIGQGDADVADHCDVPVYVMTAEFGAHSQLEKIDMLDFAQFVVLNKFEKPGSQDAVRAVRKQFRRNHNIGYDIVDEKLPVFGTIASQFNDSGVNAFFVSLMDKIGFDTSKTQFEFEGPVSAKQYTILPGDRQRYLAEIAETCRAWRAHAEAQADIATKLYQLDGAQKLIGGDAAIEAKIAELKRTFDRDAEASLQEWPELKERYSGDEYVQVVRNREIRVELKTISQSGTPVSKVAVPRFRDWGDIVRWQMLENLPGRFPYTAGVFEFKRQGEDPKRMFAGEGTPDRTNTRFHFLCEGEPANRLSTAFDSVTLYGEDPHPRPDIYGKVGNSGVSVCSLDDMKRLYSGFDLSDPKTSVSMTINGPAPIILAMFLNTAIDQQVDKFVAEHGKAPSAAEHAAIFDRTLKVVRGTVQADILKEDQAQNTCIFSTDFALKMMGDIQQYFVEKEVRNYYSVSISGYHIAEAGANPITQTAFTLANGFTFVEYYLARGMNIDDFAPNLSFFFSNGMDPEYAVLGRVARRIWAVAMHKRYGASERSQKLKYHIQTSGRSLHAQEVDFNDIRTTLQALLAFYDNCNSLHTNAYDEAVTTPTEDSVRRAMAIQLILTREFGMMKNENPQQGAFIVDELTDLMEEAVLAEFEAISSRGGVLGAMERQYQRSKIQDESILYEMKKHSGEIPIVGVNTYLPKDGAANVPIKLDLIRSSEDEKQTQLKHLAEFQTAHKNEADDAMHRLRQVALANGNVFEELMSAVKHCSLGQITHLLYEVGGQYRRSM
jgi:methylmalonyl-CoA mutase